MTVQERLDQHLSRSPVVDPTAWVGANATVVCGTTIGRYAMVGAGSVVTHAVPDFALVYGVPAVQHGWVCQCGTLIGELKLIYNKTRQAAITKELSEIVSGAAAISG